MKICDYDIKIYTTIRRRPYNMRVCDVDFLELSEIIRYIEKHGITIGQYEDYGILLNPVNIRYFRWARAIRILNWFYIGDYLNKETVQI